MIAEVFKQYQGESAALGAAFLWASASVVYTVLGQQLSPLLLNSLKGLVAIALTVLTLLLTQTDLGKITPFSMIILSLSGVIGIGIGDTAYFSALRYLGARKTLLLETLAPPMAAIFAFIFLGETLETKAWMGIILTLIGVAWVITERTPDRMLNSPQFKQGIVWGIMAAIAQSVGAVLARSALTLSNITPLESSLIRLVSGTLTALLLWQIMTNYRPKNISSIEWSMPLVGVIILTAFASTYLGIWLQQTALKFAPTGIAQTLMATSPLFVLPVSFFLGEKISWRTLIGVFIALGGIGLLFLM